MANEISWKEGHSLIANLGSEDWLAQRIEAERKSRGWSQAELSKQLGAIGYPLHQSAISKIERPPKADGRRAITINEAIGFARVFDIPLGELLLPPDSVSYIEFAKSLSDGPEKLRVKIMTDAQYNNLLDRLAEQVQADRDRLTLVVARLQQETTRITDAGGDPNDHIPVLFLLDVLERTGMSLSEQDEDPSG